MKEVKQTGPSTRQRLLQVAAIVSALSIVGSYVAWSQHQANQRAKLKKQQTEQALAAKAEAQAVSFEGFVNYGSPIVTADGLALSSKSISNPIFSTRRVDENQAPDVSAPDLIGGSKPWAHAIVPERSVPVELGKGFEVPTKEEAPPVYPNADIEPGKNAGVGGRPQESHRQHLNHIVNRIGFESRRSKYVHETVQPPVRSFRRERRTTSGARHANKSADSDSLAIQHGIQFTDCFCLAEHRSAEAV